MDFLTSSIMGPIFVIAAAAALGGLVYEALRLAFPPVDPEEAALAEALAAQEAERKERRSGKSEDTGLAETEFLKRAVDVIANLADRQGLLGATERLLMSADLPIRPSEALFFYLVAVVLAGPAGFAITGAPMMALLLVALVAIGPVFYVRRLAKKRAEKFLAQLPDMLTMLAGSLQAGRSLGQALEATSHEFENPMGRELKKIVAEVRLGWPLADAMGDAAERLNSPDFAWAVTAIRIQSEVGGNLSELLMTVADTMRARTQFKGEVRALTAEGRISALILTLLPVGMGAALYVLNPDYIGTLFESTTGQIMVAVGAGMIGIGYVLMKKVVQVDL